MIGERVHSYEVNAHLGQGGMGNVFRATDSMLGREVALKMLHPQLTVQPQFLERFRKEARVLAQLLHPNIAVIYNFIEQGGNHFMVMEYVEGTSLDDLLKKYRTLPAEFVVPVFIQALEGLQHAHRKNIFHRDIKPANLMITEDGTLKLMDFGIAKIAGEQKMTQVNKIVGTIEFMAPELIEGKDASPASDIYAMGTTLYELISGKIPFEGDTDFNIMQAILKSKVKPPDKLNVAVPRALSEIVLKAMDKNPAARYPDAKSFQRALMSAFPQYKDIDITVLKKAQQTVYAAKHTTEVMQPTKMVDSTSMETRVELSKPLAAFQLYKQKAASNKKLLLVLAALLVIILSVFFLIPKKNIKTDETVIVSKDTATQVVQNNINTGTSEGAMPVAPANNIQLPQQDNRISVADEPVPVNEIPVKKEKPVKNPKKDVTMAEGNSIEKKQSNDPPPASKPPEITEIIINSTVMVSLSLIGTPDLNEKKKTTQPMKFLVTRPVVYNGTTIVKQGAIANGSLTIGSRNTDIKIDNVEAANGKVIQLKSEKAHGKRKDIETDRNYTAIIQQGTIMNF